MIGSVMMGVSVALLLVGMVGGMVMGAQHDFTLAPAHAHLNLIGGVLLFLFGLYYRVIPAVGASRLAQVQGWLHIAGSLLMPGGLALFLTEGPAYMPVLAVGSLVATVAVALFGFIVIRTARVKAQPVHHAHPTDRRHGPHPASHPQPFHGIVQHSDSSGARRRQDLRTDSQTHGQGIEG